MANVQETDLTAHLYFEAHTCLAVNKPPPNLTPLVSDLDQWLDYWKGRATNTTAANAISKAMRYLAPQSKQIFTLLTSSDPFLHGDMDDWDAFEALVRRTFRVTKAELAFHPISASDWLRPIRVSQAGKLPRNTLLQLLVNSARKPVKHIAKLVFGRDGGPGNIPEMSNNMFRQMFAHWQACRAIPADANLAFFNNAQGNPYTAANLPFHSMMRCAFVAGAGFALQLQAYHDFKNYCVPAVVGEGMGDLMEKKWQVDQHVDFFKVYPEILDTYLTTMVGTSGRTLAESPNATTKAAAVMVIDGRMSEEIAMQGYRPRHNGNNEGSDGNQGGRGRGKGKGKGKGKTEPPGSQVHAQDGKEPSSGVPPAPAPHSQPAPVAPTWRSTSGEDYSG